MRMTYRQLIMDKQTRRALARFVEAAIDLLDAIDGEADYEQEVGLDQNDNPITLNCNWREDVQVGRPSIVAPGRGR